MILQKHDWNTSSLSNYYFKRVEVKLLQSLEKLEQQTSMQDFKTREERLITLLSTLLSLHSLKTTKTGFVDVSSFGNEVTFLKNNNQTFRFHAYTVGQLQDPILAKYRTVFLGHRNAQLLFDLLTEPFGIN